MIMSRPLIIAPSVLAADFGNLDADIARAVSSGADWLHIDIMDGHFVPNISFGPAICKTIYRKAGKIPLDVHLMIERPDKYLKAFADAGAWEIIIHLEAKDDVAATLKKIRGMGLKAGLAINPGTPVEPAFPFFPEIDLFLCMTVNPGFGGQSFMSEVMDKVKKARMHADQQGLELNIEVDGGINQETAVTATRAGANVLVAGTSLFSQKDMREAVSRMREECAP